MHDPLPPMDSKQQAASRRRAVIRTVLVLVAVALAFYLLAIFGGSLPGGAS